MNSSMQTNSSTDDTKSIGIDERWNWFLSNIFVWLFPPLCVVGAVANACSFVVIVSRRKSFPYVTRQYVAIITVNDFLTLTLKAGIHYTTEMAIVSSYFARITHPRYWGFSWCAAYLFFSYYVMVGAQFFQLGLTVDRLVAVAAPMKAKIILSHKRSWIMLAVISGMALLLPVVLVSNIKWDDAEGLCDIRSLEFHRNIYQKMELSGRVILMSVLMLGTIAMCVLLALRNRSARRMQAQALVSIQQQRISRERRRSLVRMSFILIFLNVLLTVTSLPWSIVNLLKLRIVERIGYKSFLLMLRYFITLEYLNSALNWAVYFMGHKFRQAFVQIYVASARQRAGGCRGGMRTMEQPLRMDSFQTQQTV